MRQEMGCNPTGESKQASCVGHSKMCCTSIGASGKRREGEMRADGRKEGAH